MEDDTRSGPLGTGEVGRNKGLKLAATYNKEERKPPLNPVAATGGGDGAGTSAAHFAAVATWDAEPALAAARQAAAAEGMDVEDLSQQMGDLTSPPKPPAPKKPKKGWDGGSSSQALELTETQE